LVCDLWPCYLLSKTTDFLVPLFCRAFSPELETRQLFRVVPFVPVIFTPKQIISLLAPFCYRTEFPQKTYSPGFKIRTDLRGCGLCSCGTADHRNNMAPLRIFRATENIITGTRTEDIFSA
jgi:hypothetical protein